MNLPKGVYCDIPRFRLVAHRFDTWRASGEFRGGVASVPLASSAVEQHRTRCLMKSRSEFFKRSQSDLISSLLHKGVPKWLATNARHTFCQSYYWRKFVLRLCLPGQYMNENAFNQHACPEWNRSDLIQTKQPNYLLILATVRGERYGFAWQIKMSMSTSLDAISDTVLTDVRWLRAGQAPIASDGMKWIWILYYRLQCAWPLVWLVNSTFLATPEIWA